MWMPEYGLGHNVLMGLGYVIGIGFPAILGIILYFAVRSWPEGDDAGNCDSDEMPETHANWGEIPERRS